jgi:serine phosphatase RsbU (regulator of sigma subunit)
MVLCYLFNDYEEGMKNTKGCEKELKALFATALFGLVNFYGSLIRLALCGSSGFFRRKLMMIRVALNQKLMKIWAKHAPMNYLHKFQVIEAERARIKGDYGKAMELYDHAIDNAHNSGYINDEALIYEITARHLVARGQNRSAGVYINAAVRAYRAWGAAAKCKELVDRYGKIIEDHVSKTSTDSTMTDTTINASIALDFSAIMKASQALSSEIDLAKLLETMMKLAITHSGAQKGFLIMEKEKKLYIEAVGGINKDVEVLTSIPLEKSMELSAGIVQYVYRDQKPVLLDNAVHDSMFMNDPYVRNNKPKSILCAPISKKGNDAVIIYLENNLSSSTFTAERLKLLRVLTSQAAISIENARLLVHRENSARLSREMEIAENIQTALLPPEPVITGYEVAAFMKPADEVGGDYYDVINIEGRDWIVIGDVSGHGLHSGLFMMMAQTSIRTALTQNPKMEPPLLLKIINSVLSHNIKALDQDKYMTITVFACHDKGQFYFAGLHQDIMVYRKKTSKVECIITDGMWVGLDFECIYDIHSLQLDSGDVMLLYTDGVTEAWKKESVKNERTRQDMFGDERLCEIFAEQGKAPATDIIQAVVQALESYNTVDDVTLVVIRRL